MVSRFIDVNRHSFENGFEWRTPNFVATYRHLRVEVDWVALLGYRKCESWRRSLRNGIQLVNAG